MARSNTDTVRFDDGEWAPPVETRDQLWQLAPEGQLCFVKAENRIYVRENRSWRSTSGRSKQTA